MATLQTPAVPVAVCSMALASRVSDALKRPSEVPSVENFDDALLFAPATTMSFSSGEPPRKKAKQRRHTVVSSDDEAGTSSGVPIVKKKKSQMKYDPEVPMSKEEATVWRREQRRKRNRESAAASRQRQRDRITELEAEVDQYKEAYEAVQAQIKALEEHQSSTIVSRSDTKTPEPVSSFLAPASPTTSTFLDLNAGDGIVDKLSFSATPASLKEQLHQQQPPFKMISRHAVQNHSPIMNEGIATPCPEACLSTAHDPLWTRPLGTIKLSFWATNAITPPFIPTVLETRLATKITIPAVKITGDSADVVASSENAVVAEDYFLSTTPEPVPSTEIHGGDWTNLDDLLQATLDPIESSLFPVKSTVDALEDPDLGEFLLDAVDWLQ